MKVYTIQKKPVKFMTCTEAHMAYNIFRIVGEYSCYCFSLWTMWKNFHTYLKTCGKSQVVLSFILFFNGAHFH
jgi:hypothetical protein